MFRRILIANRGEIAVRVIHACRELGIESVAVYSDADARALHTTLADRAVRIGPPPASQSYLSTEAVLDAARETGADAIHPGYGFLSENHEFAAACSEAAVTFIGPSSDVIARMGSKIAARRLAVDAGVPVVPGEIPREQTDEGLADAASRLGFPLLVKPSAGGGGIGMKHVTDPAQLRAAVGQARREALAAFGDGTLYLERLLERPRHIELQILGDHAGHVVHLFERECSLQRRHQKIIEETPSPALTPRVRAQMGQAATNIARASNYTNAGTVEFLVEGEGDAASFYFLEVNTRLQVEHPVTEQTTGVDVVRAQITVAAGDPLPWSQDQLQQRGHAIEARIYAEDPSAHDLPQAGRLLLYREPTMPGIRVDAGVVEGDDISIHYDPMMAKLIAWGDSREAARARALAALRNYPVLGVRTNIAFLIELLQHPDFVDGHLHTGLVDAVRGDVLDTLNEPPPSEARAVALHSDQATTAIPHAVRTDHPSEPWSSLRGWRG